MEHVITELGWDWRADGVVFHLVQDGRPLQWFIPISYVRMIFGRELAKVGCPLEPEVNGPPTVAGFFGSLGRSLRRASRSIKRKVRNTGRSLKRAARTVSRGAKSAVKRVVPKSIRKGISRAAKWVQRAAINAGKAYSNIERKVLKTVAYVPVLGNVANAALSAARIRDRFLLQGRVPKAKDLMDLGRAAGSAALDVFAPGAGTLANAALTAGAGLATGQRWDRALVAAGTQAASKYVPESITRGALRAGTQIARGRRLDRALASGALETARHYVPGGAIGQQVYAGARDIASGKRVDRVLKKRLMKAAKLRGLSKIVPNSAAFGAARNALQVAQQAQAAAARMRRGVQSSADALAVMRGRNTMAGVQALRRRAVAGDRASRQFLAAYRVIG